MQTGEMERVVDGRGRDRTAGLYRVKVVPALYPHGSSLSWPTKTNQTSPHLGAIGQKLGSRGDFHARDNVTIMRFLDTAALSATRSARAAWAAVQKNMVIRIGT